MPSTQGVMILPYRPAWAAAFRDLNIAWIEALFRVEPVDLEVLDDPQRAIIATGGEIFFAVAGDVPVGCCAALRGDGDRWELTKMAVDPAWRGRGLGEALGRAVVDHAFAHGARLVYLFTNSSLHGAIRLYERIGFAHAPMPPEGEYERGDVYMTRDERR